ncbi:hypothetical protein HPB50_021967 [Hyalomma asiaticum]|uniref:Uncharacterized protein n=1 Tax=Hyalomma asiaticum TaxID=266040 RepID=A0ACB7TJZ6_HYAAI|nr:hypothetical protein HPB50_021967 [Hyalomma asiaticum]
MFLAPFTHEGALLERRSRRRVVITPPRGAKFPTSKRSSRCRSRNPSGTTTNRHRYRIVPLASLEHVHATTLTDTDEATHALVPDGHAVVHTFAASGAVTADVVRVFHTARRAMDGGEGGTSSDRGAKASNAEGLCVGRETNRRLGSKKAAAVKDQADGGD